MVQGAGNQVSVGDIVARIRFNVDSSGLDTASAGIAGVTSGITRLNPLIIAGTAALGGLIVGLQQATTAAIALESAQARLRANVGLTSDEVEAYRPQLRGLAADYGVAETAATNALFPILSGGFRGAEAFDILEQSVIASVAGLGELETLTPAVITALQAYDDLTAPQFFDQLNQAALNSVSSADEIGAVLGRIAGPAAAAGIGFDELVSSLAAMSRTQQSASVNAAGLRQIIQSLTQPTAQATKVIESLGITTDDLRAMVEDDLLGALQFLQTALEGDVEAFGDVFGSVEAFGGVLALLGSDAEDTANIFNDVRDSVGSLGDSYNEVADTTQTRLNRATAQISNVFSDMGAIVLPFVASALTALLPLLQSASDLFTRPDSGLLQTLRVIGTVASFIFGVIQQIWRVIQPILSVAGRVLGFIGGGVGRVISPSAFGDVSTPIVTPAPTLDRIDFGGTGRGVNVGNVNVTTNVNTTGGVDAEEISDMIGKRVNQEIGSASRGVFTNSTDGDIT